VGGRSPLVPDGFAVRHPAPDTSQSWRSSLCMQHRGRCMWSAHSSMQILLIDVWLIRQRGPQVAAGAKSLTARILPGARQPGLPGHVPRPAGLRAADRCERGPARLLQARCACMRTRHLMLSSAQRPRAAMLRHGQRTCESLCLQGPAATARALSEPHLCLAAFLVRGSLDVPPAPA